MRPSLWQPPLELSAQEEQIVKRIRQAKLFVFLRQHRHELFDGAFQKELASLYRKAERGHPLVAPAVLALALILEAYTGVSDDEVIEATLMDRRWQLVLDCLDTDQAPFSKGTLVAFRKRLIESHMDRRLSSEPLRWPVKVGLLGRERCALLWIVVRYGGQDESKICTIWWDMHSKRPYARWLINRRGSGLKWRAIRGPSWCVEAA